MLLKRDSMGVLAEGDFCAGFAGLMRGSLVGDGLFGTKGVSAHHHQLTSTSVAPPPILAAKAGLDILMGDL